MEERCYTVGPDVESEIGTCLVLVVDAPASIVLLI